jgi:hypothetical protein
MRIYNKETTPFGQEIIWYEEDGFRVSFFADPEHPEYQAYLASLDEADSL